ncbi:MAG: HK97 family phage prohead protease [bacterium]
MRKPEYSTLGLDLSKMELHSEGDHRTLVGYASAFNVPMPGDFGEAVVMRPGAFTKTLKENLASVQVLYHHGKDPQIGKKPLGRPRVINQDATGLWTETPLSKTQYNDEIIIPLLEDRTLRAMSVSIGVVQERWNKDRTERAIHQVVLDEFGPTPFPRNLGATAALHSLEFPPEALRWEEHWDGAAALRTCSNAAEFRKIAFERNNDSDPDTAAHWALPHHPNWRGAPDNADPGGVGAALAALHGGRGGAPDLKQSVDTVESHLQAHQAESSSAGDRSTQEAAASLGADRLTLSRELSKQGEGYDAEVAKQAARYAALYGKRFKEV